MILSRHPAPHIRNQESNRTLTTDVILLLGGLTMLAFLFYGMRALAVCGAAVLAAVLADFVCVLLRGRRPNLFDLSPVVTGLIIALSMPATIPYRVVVAASLFAILIAKHPFGGMGNNLFNPAAAGFSFAAICWPQQTFLYPTPLSFTDSWYSLFGTLSVRAQTFTYSVPGLGGLSELTAALPRGAAANIVGAMHETVLTLSHGPALVLKMGGAPGHSLSEMLLGNYPGPMGATNILVILACLLYLLYRRTIPWQLPISFLLTCGTASLIFPRMGGNPLQAACYELMSGMLLFGAVFVISDPVTSPKRGAACLVYGALAGMITLLFRYYGGFEESMPFAILFANALVPVIDRYSETLNRRIRRKRREPRKTKKVQKI